MVPSAIAPGDIVTMYGDFRWSRLNMERYIPDDPRGYVRQMEIGGFLCGSKLHLRCEHKQR
jgi:hypothetical protein